MKLQQAGVITVRLVSKSHLLTASTCEESGSSGVEWNGRPRKKRANDWLDEGSWMRHFALRAVEYTVCVCRKKCGRLSARGADDFPLC